ncbi:MAG: response regulator [Bacteroidota bacterium]
MPHKKKILIIDDETDLCLLLKDYFTRKKNYEVTLSHSLADGISLVSAIKPDILFLDNNLPDDEGWKEAPGIATDNPQTYIVLVSAYHPSVPSMPVADMFRVIEKPISFSDLDAQFGTF